MRRIITIFAILALLPLTACWAQELDDPPYVLGGGCHFNDDAGAFGAFIAKNWDVYTAGDLQGMFRGVYFYARHKDDIQAVAVWAALEKKTASGWKICFRSPLSARCTIRA